MVCGFLLLFLLGCPIAFSMLIPSLAYVVVKGMPLTFLAGKTTSGIISFPLLAIPFFLLAGELMNRVAVADRIFNFANTLVGHIKGGLAHVNVVASIIFAGMSGSAIADAGGLGALEIKAMNEAGFDRRFSAAITAASSTIGPIIPPSVPMVLYGVMTGQSIARLFAGGLIPGILMGVSLMVIAYIIAGRRGFPRQRKASIREVAGALRAGFFALLAPVLLIGAIIAGIATPTEIGVLLVAYVIVLSIIYRSFDFREVWRSLVSSSKLVAQILFLIAAASLFCGILIFENVPQVLTELVAAAHVNRTIILLGIDVILLFLGCFVEGTAIITLMAPILVPVVSYLGIDLVHFGVVMVLAVEIGLITPPLGLCLYIASEIAEVPIEQAVPDTLLLTVPLVIVLVLISCFPQITLFLPNLLFGS